MTIKTCRHCGAVNFEWYDFNMDDRVSPNEAVQLGGQFCGCRGARDDLKYKMNFVEDGILVVMDESII